MSIYDEIERTTGIKRKSVSAKELLTIRIGGVLKNAFAPRSVKELARLLDEFEILGIKPFILGGGSNVVADDGEIETPVLLTKYIDGVRIENGVAFCECGVKIADVLRLARERDLGGLEFLAGVPLTIGGAIKMNASAFGRQIFDLVERVFVLSRACEKRVCDERACATPLKVVEKKKDEIDFAYRKGADGIVVGTILRLDEISAGESKRLTQEFLRLRREKQPIGLSVGSVFKNGEQPAGKLIEGCGLKGLKIGGAKISEKHANFIVNEDGANASDFLALVETCEREVAKKFNVQLEREFVWLK